MAFISLEMFFFRKKIKGLLIFAWFFFFFYLLPSFINERANNIFCVLAERAIGQILKALWL